MSGPATPHRVVTLAGHVDHGKSTLVAALTGMTTDRLAEERRRGLTIELGFTWLELPPTADHPGTSTVALVDVPGHERFLATMVAGAGCASAALLVCAADEGPSVQTREHLEVLQLLELPLLAVVITKADRVDASRLAACEAEVAALLAPADLAATPVVPVDGHDTATLAPLLHVLRTRLAALPPVPGGGRARLWIDRVFTVEGSGTVVTGTLGGGALSVGSDARLLPSGRSVRVRRLESLGHGVDPAAAGTRVAVNLGGTGRDEVRRGDALEAVPRGAGEPATTTSFDALVWRTDGDEVAGGLDGARRLHVGTSVTACRVRPVASTASGGSEALAVRVRTDAPLALRTGDRILLTGTGNRRIVAGGIVVDPRPADPRGPEARALHAERVAATGQAARAGRHADVVRGLVALAGGMRDAGELATLLGSAEPRIAAVEGTLAVGGSIALPDRLADLPAQLATLGAHVVAVDELATTLVRLGHARAHVDDLVEHLVATGRLRRTALGLVVEQHAEDAVDAREARYAAVVARIEDGAFDPPDFRTVADEEGLDHRERVQLLASERLVRCGDVVVGRTAFARAVDLLHVLDADTRGTGFTAAQARDALTSTRRVTVPMLEEMARRRITRFDGTHHHLVDQRSASTTSR